MQRNAHIFSPDLKTAPQQGVGGGWGGFQVGFQAAAKFACFYIESSNGKGTPDQIPLAWVAELAP